MGIGMKTSPGLYCPAYLGTPDDLPSRRYHHSVARQLLLMFVIVDALFTMPGYLKAP